MNFQTNFKLADLCFWVLWLNTQLFITVCHETYSFGIWAQLWHIEDFMKDYLGPQ